MTYLCRSTWITPGPAAPLPVVETHPESIVDLRLAHPFPALVEYAISLDYDSMDSEQHGHIPAVAILIKALEDWKTTVGLPLQTPLAQSPARTDPLRNIFIHQHGGQSPTGSAVRKQFTDSVLALKRQNDEENFDEAVTLYRRAGTRHGVRSSTIGIRCAFHEFA